MTLNVDLSQLLPCWMTLNVDKFDITTHVHWFWIVWTKCWNWVNLSFSKTQGTDYLFICYIVSCMLIDKCERTTNQFDLKILPQDKYYLKNVLFGWFVWGNSFLKQLFRNLYSLLGFPPEFRVTVYVRKWSGNFFHFHYGKGSGKPEFQNDFRNDFFSVKRKFPERCSWNFPENRSGNFRFPEQLVP